MWSGLALLDSQKFHTSPPEGARTHTIFFSLISKVTCWALRAFATKTNAIVGALQARALIFYTIETVREQREKEAIINKVSGELINMGFMKDIMATSRSRERTGGQMNGRGGTTHANSSMVHAQSYEDFDTGGAAKRGKQRGQMHATGQKGAGRGMARNVHDEHDGAPSSGRGSAPEGGTKQYNGTGHSPAGGAGNSGSRRREDASSADGHAEVATHGNSKARSKSDTKQTGNQASLDSSSKGRKGREKEGGRDDGEGDAQRGSLRYRETPRKQQAGASDKQSGSPNKGGQGNKQQDSESAVQQAFAHAKQGTTESGQKKQGQQQQQMSKVDTEGDAINTSDGTDSTQNGARSSGQTVSAGGKDGRNAGQNSNSSQTGKQAEKESTEQHQERKAGAVLGEQVNDQPSSIQKGRSNSQQQQKVSVHPHNRFLRVLFSLKISWYPCTLVLRMKPLRHVPHIDVQNAYFLGNKCVGTHVYFVAAVIKPPNFP